MGGNDVPPPGYEAEVEKWERDVFAALQPRYPDLAAEYMSEVAMSTLQKMTNHPLAHRLQARQVALMGVIREVQARQKRLETSAG
jgi:hypothetical protein